MSDRNLIGGMSFESATLGQTFRRLAETYADQVVLRTIDDSVSLTWKELLGRVDALAGGLAKLGLRRGDTIALMLSNRPEFHLVDLAAVTLGATPFSIYQTLSPEQIQYVVSDAGAKIAIVETAYLSAFLEAKANLPDVEHVVVIDGDGEGGTLKLSDVEDAQPDFDAAAHAAAVQPEDLLTLIYTSGTTGPPK
jgi:long-subunit acyl-CoA synthetase (AMP-forming)